MHGRELAPHVQEIRASLKRENPNYPSSNEFKIPYYRVILREEKILFIKNYVYLLCDMQNNSIAVYGLGESLLEQECDNKKVLREKNNENSQINSILSDVIQLIGKDLEHDHSSNVLKQKANETVDLTPQVQLSKREIECVECMLQGKTAKETAKILMISPRTVESYIESIKNKYTCSTKLEIISMYLKSKSSPA